MPLTLIGESGEPCRCQRSISHELLLTSVGLCMYSPLFYSSTISLAVCPRLFLLVFLPLALWAFFSSFSIVSSFLRLSLYTSFFSLVSFMSLLPLSFVSLRCRFLHCRVYLSLKHVSLTSLYIISLTPSHLHSFPTLT